MILADADINTNFSSPVFEDKDQIKVETELRKTFRSYLIEKTLTCYSNSDRDFVTVQVLLQDSEGEFYYPIQARCKWDGKRDLSKKDTALFLLDQVAVYLNEYFMEPSTLLTIEWSSHEHSSRSYELRGQIFNKKLETMADEFLKQHDSSL